MDLVLIESLGVDTVIGVYDWERTITQRLVLDLALATDIRPAAADDDFALVETFAERLAETLRREFGIPWLRLTVRKPGAVAAAAAVGVQIERGARPEAS